MINWQTGSWTSDSTAPNSASSGACQTKKSSMEKVNTKWRMTIASDWAPMNEYEKIMLDNPKAVYGDLLDSFLQSDLNVVNVEAVLGQGGKPIAKAGPHLSGDPRTVAALNVANFQVGCLANNHIMDLSIEGLRQTRKTLHDAGIQTVGAGETIAELQKPVVKSVKPAGCNTEIKIGIINCAEGESGRSEYGQPGVYGLDVLKVSRQIADLKQSGSADVVVVIFHGGREHAAVPPPYVVHDLRQIAQAGADAVVAHHPHVPQAVEIHGGVPIAYSLGNFVFWQKSERLYNNIGYLFHLDFLGKKLAGCSLTPYVLQPTGLKMMQDGQRNWFFNQMEKATRPLEKSEDIHAVWAAFVDYHGVDNALAMLQKLTENMKNIETSAKAGATLKNLFFTPAHANLYSELFDRSFKGTIGSAPKWARDLMEEWFCQTSWQKSAGKSI